MAIVKIQTHINSGNVTELAAIAHAQIKVAAADSTNGRAVNGEEVITKLYYIVPILGKIFIVVSEQDRILLGASSTVLLNSLITDYQMIKLPSQMIKYKEVLVRDSSTLTTTEVKDVAQYIADKESEKEFPSYLPVVKVVNYSNSSDPYLVMPSIFGNNIFKVDGIVSSAPVTNGNTSNGGTIIDTINGTQTPPGEAPLIIGNSFSINENVSIGTSVGALGITTLGDSAISSFTLAGTNASSFSVDFLGNVTTAANIDYESITSYALTAYATNNDGNSNIVNLGILVNNIGEIVPVLEVSTLSIAENVAIGTQVGVINVTSAGDTTITGFTLTGADASSFTIDSAGNVKTAVAIDFETKSSYTIGAYATNAAGNSSTVSVTVAVTDILDGPPVIEGGSFSIDENLYTTAMGSLNVTSIGGSAINGFTLMGTGAGDFNISGTGAISNDTPLDFETKPSYNLTATAYNTSGTSNTVNVSIAVNNIPDVVPVIASSNFSVDENVAIGTTIGSVTVTSIGDSPITGYDGVTSRINIDANGLITTAEEIDYEQITNFGMSIRAINAAGYSEWASLAFNVNDLAEGNPAPVLEIGTFSVTEEQSMGAAVGTVSIVATGHSAINGFTLTGTGSSLFDITSAGVITTTAPLDYETATSYTLSAQASNNNGSSNVVNITINVNNISDVLPILAGSTFSINENVAIGTQVGTVSVTTAGDSPITSYTADTADFTIDANGIIKTAVAIDYENIMTYSLNVFATNGAGDSLATIIDINVNNLNDVVPTIDDLSGQTEYVEENAVIGTVITTINVSDDGGNAVSSFTLTGADASSFTVDANGNIKTAVAMDYETKTSYTIGAYATNGAGNSNTTTVNIGVTNMDDVVPVIVGNTFSIDEDASNGATVGTLVVTTAGDSAITEFILSGTGAGDFNIDESGVITTMMDLDYAVKSVYNLQVYASNVAGNSQPVTLRININNIATVVPILVGDTFSINENVAIGTTVGTVSLTTAGDSSITSYTIDTTDFTIDANGIIKTAVAIDYENIMTYSPNVYATNTAGNSEPVTIDINVTDLNDIAPIIDDLSGQTFEVNENVAIGTQVTTVNVSDDGGSTVTSFTMTGTNSNRFTIDSSGTVKTAVPIDYETTTSYSFSVYATSAAGNSNIETLVITVYNEEDVVPVLLPGTFNIDENVTNGANVGTLAISNAGDSVINEFALAGTGAGDFNIDESGVITTMMDLDYNAISTYNLTAYATNMAGNSASVAVVITLNKIYTATKVIATDGAASDRFAHSVAANSTKIVVGSYKDDDNGTDSGSAYIYDLDGTNEIKLNPSDASSYDYFGYSVAVGTKIVVGSYNNDDNGTNSGSAYIYDLDGTNEIKLTASDAASNDYFGYSLATSGAKVVVGAYRNDDAGEDSGSVYIYDIDGTNEIKVTASDAAIKDYFGASVAVGNTKMVVGAWGDDDNGANAGSAYIYDLDGTNEIKIKASDGLQSDLFGTSVAINNNKIVVGAYYVENNGTNSGSIYIYDLDGTNEIKLTASDINIGDWFGYSVAISNNKILVGSYSDDDNGNSSGSVYMYDMDGTNEIKLTAPDGAVGDNFGYSIDITNDKVVVGSYKDDDNGSDSGSVYIYDLGITDEIKITSSDIASNDFFGGTVAANNTKMVVGAYGNADNGGRTGSAYIYDLDGTNEIKVTASDGTAYDDFGIYVDINDTKIVVGSPYDDDNASNSGAIYLYDLDGTNEIKIKASDATVDDYFGYAVAISNTKIVVGSYRDDDNATNSGSVYIYDIDGTNEIKITASDFATGDKFGHAVAISNNKVVVGAYQNGDNGSGSGSAYIYDLDGTNEIKLTASDGSTWATYGYAVAISNNKVVVGASGAIGNEDKTGAIYIYNLDGTNETKVIASDGLEYHAFGDHVAIDNTKIVVAANGTADNGAYSGAIYIYNLDGTNETKVIASDGTAGDRLGSSVAMNDNKIVVGAYLDDENGTYSGSVYIYNR